MDDRTLVLQTLEGNEKAFEELVKRYERSVFSIAFSHLRSYENARDITQEVFLIIYRKLKNFDVNRRLFSWIAAITIHYTYRYLKSNRKTRDLNEEEWEAIPWESAEPFGTDDKIALFDAMDKLGQKERSLIILRYFEGFEIEEIAETMDMGVSAVKVALMRARDRLKLIIEGLYER